MGFSVEATDDRGGPLTFQFNIAFGSEPFTVAQNFNVGSQTETGWVARPFFWAGTQGDGSYQIQAVAMNFNTGESDTAVLPFTFQTLVSGNQIAVVPTANPLVALAAVPPCEKGNLVRVTFQAQASSQMSRTPFQSCQAPASTNFYVAGLYAGMTYKIGFEIARRGIAFASGGRGGMRIVSGATTALFTAGEIPSTLSFPAPSLLEMDTSAVDQNAGIVLHSYISFRASQLFSPAATDLAGNVVWYYPSDDPNLLLTRPLRGGYFFVIHAGPLWNTGGVVSSQLIRKVDLAGNTIQETNIGLLQRQLAALGAPDLQPCSNIALPTPVGAACLTAFSHEAMELPDGKWAVIGSVEKVFPPGTQGDTTGLNVDVVGDAIIVLDPQLNVVWHWDAFEHAGGGTELDINRPAVLGETCTRTTGGCPPLILAGTPGLSASSNDWTHSNSLTYSFSDGNLILSVRDQDWGLKIDYRDGAGTGDVLWRMGPGGDFAFDNVAADPFPWFSHQHDIGVENDGTFTVFDDGNTRVATLGEGNSRGMALQIDENAMTVTPIFSQDLGYYAYALGSAQLLSNGNFFFQPGIATTKNESVCLEFSREAGQINGAAVYTEIEPVPSYRSARMPDLYTPPET